MLIIPYAQDLEEFIIMTSCKMGTGPLCAGEMVYAGLPRPH